MTEKERLGRNRASQKWKDKNPERVWQSYRRWYENGGADKRRECRKRYRLLHPKERPMRTTPPIRQWQKEYDRLRYLRPENVAKRERLKFEKRKYNRDYYQRNKERWLSRCYRDRALKRKNLVGNLQDITKWMKSWRTPKHVRCYWCGNKSRGLNCHGDHIVALSDGGAHSLENLCISCSTCNMRKHNKPLSIWNQQITEPVLL
jgi:hypothetical protein